MKGKFMRIIIAGGTGLIGKALTESLLENGHQVWILTRDPQKATLQGSALRVGWDGRTSKGWEALVSQVDAIVNLTGESLGSGPWTRERKNRILSSRVEAGKAISDAILQANPQPKVLIQASAVGFYGSLGAEPATEDSAPGGGFLAQVCEAWENSSRPVEESGVRRVILRTGVVLSRGEGTLQRMMLPFKLFVGGPLGDGRQGLPWIHLADEVAGIRFLLETETARGVYNLSAPEPLSNARFGRILAKEMRRPYWLPVPAFVLRLILGEMSTLVLQGQYVFPKRLQELGFRFKYATVESALQDLLSG
jgi:uncharacterized protein (TIGR01777 family)